MRRIAPLCGLVLLVLVIASPAPAKWFAITIEDDGFSVKNLTVRVGDSVGWTNKGDQAHRLTCAKCPFRSNVLGGGDSYAYSFTKPGTFAVVASNGNRIETVTVKPALASLTAVASPALIGYGKSSKVAGKVSSHRAGQQVEILAQPCLGTSINVVGRVKTKKGGAYTFVARPTVGTSYYTRFRSQRIGLVSSPTAVVSVKPIVELSRAGQGQFVARVTAGRSLVGKRVAFQRFSTKRGRWITLQSPVLKQQSEASAPRSGTIVSSRKFSSRVGDGVAVRALLPQVQGIPCYAQAPSATLHT